MFVRTTKGRKKKEIISVLTVAVCALLQVTIKKKMRAKGQAIALLLAVLAIVIGTVGKLWPHLFLTHVPRIGFMLWAMTGNRMPPHFDNEAWSETKYRKFLRTNDIVLSTMPKSGTMWLAQIIHLLKNNGTDTFESLLDTFGFLDIQQYPGQDIDERIEAELVKRQNLQAMTWGTHEFPSDANYALNAALHPSIKYVVCARNGKEVVRSFVPFINSITNDFRKRWGGFPPPITKECALKMVTSQSPNGVFDFMAEWWKLKHLDNVLLVHYADLKQNLSYEVRRIAEFLNVELSEALLKNVVQKSSFDYMKQHDYKIKIYSGKPDDRYLIFEEGKHLSKGISGGLEGFFTPEMDNIWNTSLHTWWATADPQMTQWALHGSSK